MSIGINAALVASRNHLGVRLDPHAGNNFFVEVDGLLAGSFSAVGGLQSEVEVTGHDEGGVNGYRHQLPGGTRHPRLVLTRGVTELDTLYSWHARACRGDLTRRDITVMLLDRRHVPVMWWNVSAALPVKWVGPDFNAMQSNQIAVERIELVHRGIDKPLLSRGVGAAHAVAELVESETGGR